MSQNLTCDKEHMKGIAQRECSILSGALVHLGISDMHVKQMPKPQLYDAEPCLAIGAEARQDLIGHGISQVGSCAAPLRCRPKVGVRWSALDRLLLPAFSNSGLFSTSCSTPTESDIEEWYVDLCDPFTGMQRQSPHSAGKWEHMVHWEIFNCRDMHCIDLKAS